MKLPTKYTVVYLTVQHELSAKEFSKSANNIVNDIKQFDVLVFSFLDGSAPV